VKPGEKLLVPVNPEERERRLALARQLRERLADGDAVTTAAATVTSPTIRLAVNGKLYTPDFDRMDPATVLAIRTLTTGTQVQAVTQPLEGPFGYDLFVLMARLTTSTVSFKDAEKGIYETLKENETIQRRLQDELRQQIFDDLRTTHALEINTQALERGDYGGEDPLTGSTWIIRTKGFTYTLDDYLKELGTANKSWGTLSPAERITAAKSSPLVLRHLVTIESERTQVEAEPEFLREIRSREIQEIAKEWIRRDALKDAATTEGVIREYYLKHIDRYTSASMVTVREITRRVDPGLPPSQKAEAIAKARKALEALRPEVSRSKEDFERVARRQSASISTRSRGGLIGTVPIGYRSAVVEAQLRKLRVGEVTPPIVVGSEVVMLRLDEFVGGVVQPFEVAGPLVVRDWLNEVPVKRRLARRDRVLREANFQLHF
jgi:parvulin-like peptidyl-prolyl isomerase